MSHPYSKSPPYARWSSAVRRPRPQDVDPVTAFPYKIKTSDRIVTAGSCFAQHIARHLSDAGYKHHITEAGHPVLPRSVRSAHQYGVFSARYGNIYTTKQLLQMLKRALGEFQPQENAWQHGTGWVDPFRPTIQARGFLSPDEMLQDREHHLAMVLRAMKEADYFVFTLGLTEAWECISDGAVLPLCPGIEGGKFDASKYRFRNYQHDEVANDLHASINILRAINPSVRIILTVSPVPLAATAENRHVLVSTTLSKAILRLAAEKVVTEVNDVSYFPSYEIITGSFNRGSYFAKDLRSVTEEGVSHVMKLFFKHATETPSLRLYAEVKNSLFDEIDVAGQVAESLCDERLLDGDQ